MRLVRFGIRNNYFLDKNVRQSQKIIKSQLQSFLFLLLLEVINFMCHLLISFKMKFEVFFVADIMYEMSL